MLDIQWTYRRSDTAQNLPNSSTSLPRKPREVQRIRAPTEEPPPPTHEQINRRAETKLFSKPA